VNKRVGRNEDGTTYVLDVPTTIKYDYPVIVLSDGSYEISLLGYTNAYIFVRLMAQNIYTSQFATKVELNSEITQTTNKINLSVNQKLEGYSTTEEMNASINMTADSITSEVSKKVGKNEIVSSINQSAESIKINANKVNLNGYVTITDLSGANKTTIDGSNIKTGTISSDRIDTETMIIGDDVNLISGTTPGWLRNAVPSPSGDSLNPIAYFGAFNLGQMNKPRASVGAEIWDNGEMYIRRLYTESGQNSEEYMGFIKTPLSNDPSSSINYLIGHTSSGGRGLNVNTYTESFDIYAATSDERLKENIVESTVDGLSIINAMRLISFNWKNSGEYQALGFSAQQLQTICEDFVNAVKQPKGAELEDILQVRDFNILPYTIKAIQELSQKINEQQEIIKDLTKRIDLLEKGEK
jgi:hypothetical protein